MSININSGFALGAAAPIDDRIVLTKEQMLNIDENVFPDTYFCVCKDDGTLYLFNKSNVYLESFGKFRPFSGGDSESTIELETLEDYQALVDAGTVDPFVNYVISGDEYNTLLPANSISYDKRKSGLQATTLQDAVDEVKDYVDNIGDNTVSEYSFAAPEASSSKMIAHRGLSSIAPENTIPAYELAADFGYWGAEVDIQKTKDGHFVCLHDGSVDRTTGGTGNVSTMTLDEVQALSVDMSMPFSGQSENGAGSYMYDGEGAIKIPTFEEYLQTCKKCNIVPIIELKEETLTSSDMPDILTIVDKFNMTDGVIFVAFNELSTNLLETVHELNPTIACQPIIDFTVDNIDYVASNFSPNCGIDSEYTQITKELVEYAHSKGVKVNCWTCDDEDVKNRLISYGVDYITTNKLLNTKLSEMKIGATDYELGGFEKITDAIQKSFALQSDMLNNKIYCLNPEIGNHNLFDPQNASQAESGTTPYSRAILTNISTTDSADFTTKRALDKTKYYIKEKTVYIGGGDFSKYKFTLVPFNENGLFISDLGWFTDAGYVALPDRTTFVLFYFAHIDGKTDISNTDLEAFKKFYICKVPNRRCVKFDGDFVFATKLNDNLTSLGKTSLKFNEMTCGFISDTPTNRVWCMKGLNVCGYTKAKVHYTDNTYLAVIYAFSTSTVNKAPIYTEDLGWAEDDTAIILTSGAVRIYVAFKRTDGAVMNMKDLINISNNIMIELY